MRLYTLILAASLHFPTISSAELGPETNKLIPSFSIVDELLCNGVIVEECYPLGFDFERVGSFSGEYSPRKKEKLVYQ